MEKTIFLKAILNENKGNATVENSVEKAHRIAKLLRLQVDPATLDETSCDCDLDLLDAIEQLEQCSTHSFQSDNFESDNFIDDQLEIIYDWADANRVWID